MINILSSGVILSNVLGNKTQNQINYKSITK